MALITCEDCGKEHSDLAPACPVCGRPNKQVIVQAKKGEDKSPLSASKLSGAQAKNNGCLIGCLSLIGLLVMLGIIGSLAPKPEKPATGDKKPTQSPEATTPEPVTPQGWNSTETPGIYWRWCTNDPECTSDKVIGDGGYNLMQVWCKEKACGDIYGRVNLISSSGVVVGWTNDTGYGDIGQKVQLTFDSHQDGWVEAQLTELKTGG